MQLERLKTIAKSDERTLRFHIIYLRKKISETKCNLTVTKLVQLKGEKLKHDFFESVAIYLNINTNELMSGQINSRKEKKLNTLINNLLDNEHDLLISYENLSWINGRRSQYFISFILNVINHFSFCHNESELDTKEIGNYLLDRPRKIEKSDKRPQRDKFGNIDLKLFDDISIDLEPSKYKRLLFNFEPLHPNSNNNIVESLTLQLDSAILDRYENSETSINLLIKLKSEYLKIVDTLKQNLNIFKIKNDDIIDITYQRVVKRYNVIEFLGPAETVEDKNQTIKTVIDLLFLTLDKDNFEKEFKHISDKLSLDKSKIQDFSIPLNERHWKMLVELAGGKSDSKIRKTINALINDAHKKNR